MQKYGKQAQKEQETANDLMGLHYGAAVTQSGTLGTEFNNKNNR